MLIWPNYLEDIGSDSLMMMTDQQILTPKLVKMTITGLNIYVGHRPTICEYTGCIFKSSSWFNDTSNCSGYIALND
jgi:hypothetical protein